MSALTVDHRASQGDDWDDLVRLWEETDAPEGCKVEIIDGIITVAPPPNGRHNRVADVVHRELYTAIPQDWGIYQTLGVVQPRRTGMYIPDLVVVPHDVIDELDDDTPYASLTRAELVVEITSKSNANHDRIKKAAGYAQAGVPLYLLIDGHAPGGPTITLYGEPKDDVYRTLRAVKFGEEIHLPDPFDLTIDTGSFPVS
jgi:Uma2 family endonuclease